MCFSPVFKDFWIPYLDFKIQTIFVVVPGIHLRHLVDMEDVSIVGSDFGMLLRRKPVLYQDVSIGSMTVTQRETDVRGINKVSDVNEEIFRVQLIMLLTLTQPFLNSGERQFRKEIEKHRARVFGRPVLR